MGALASSLCPVMFVGHAHFAVHLIMTAVGPSSACHRPGHVVIHTPKHADFQGKPLGSAVTPAFFFKQRMTWWLSEVISLPQATQQAGSQPRVQAQAVWPHGSFCKGPSGQYFLKLEM